MTRALICIGCPRGCHLEIDGEGESLRVTGNRYIPILKLTNILFCPKKMYFCKPKL